MINIIKEEKQNLEILWVYGHIYSEKIMSTEVLRVVTVKTTLLLISTIKSTCLRRKLILVYNCQQYIIYNMTKKNNKSTGDTLNVVSSEPIDSIEETGKNSKDSEEIETGAKAEADEKESDETMLM